MKLAHITMFFQPINGGQQTYIENLNRILIKEGIDVSVVQPLRRGVNDKKDNVIMLPIFPKLNKIFTDGEWFFFNKMLRLFRRKYKDNDILICHYPFHFPALAHHKKVIVVSHGLDWLQPPTSKADIYREKAARLCRDKNAVIVANDTNFLRYLGYDVKAGEKFFTKISDNVWFIPNCIDVSMFNEEKEANREKVVLVPRNIRSVRGIHLAIEAFYHFAKNNPEYLMKIAGGPLTGTYYMECKKRISELGLENNVLFIGSIPWDKMKNLYNTSSMTLIPTLALEGTSLSALESMACKTPVVSTNIGGLADLPCLKAEPVPEDIASRMEQVVKKWGMYSENQYASVKKNFTIEGWKEAWLSVVNALNYEKE